MGILSKQAIARQLASGEIMIVPTPRDEDYDSDAVDVHLGDKVYEWLSLPSGAIISIPLWKSPPNEFSFSKFANSTLKDVPPDNADIITLRPHTFYLADLRQHTTLPSNIAMQIQGKSSLARLGMLVHLTAPHAHAGWRGRLTLEIYNLGPFNIEMKPGMTIGQLTFWKVEEPGEVLPGHFHDQSTAHGNA
jgi:dCTP deaminase